MTGPITPESGVPGEPERNRDRRKDEGNEEDDVCPDLRVDLGGAEDTKKREDNNEGEVNDKGVHKKLSGGVRALTRRYVRESLAGLTIWSGCLFFLLLFGGVGLGRYLAYKIPFATANESMSMNEHAGAALATTVTVRAGTTYGSGVSFREDGVVLTSALLVKAGEQVEVGLAAGSTERGTVLVRDTSLGVAVVRMCSDHLAVPTTYGIEPRIGQHVFVSGLTPETGQFVTEGSVSALDWESPYTRDSRHFLISTSSHATLTGAAIRDSADRVIGILTGPHDGAGSISRAARIDAVRDLVEDAVLVDRKRAILPGIFINVDRPLADRLSLKARKGVLLQSRNVDTLLQRDSLQVGDVVLSVDGQSVSTREELHRMIAARRPCTPVDIGVNRGGKRVQLKFPLRAAP